jgi:hypothetical protein
MSESLQEAKNVEHAPRDRLGVYIGLTMAGLGVLLAISAASHGVQNIDRITSLMKQTDANVKYQALETKYRVLLAQLRQLHSLEPEPHVFHKWDSEVKGLAEYLPQGDIAKLSRVIRLENAKNLSAEMPTQGDLRNFAALIRAVDVEQKAAGEWTETYDAAVEAHELAAEHYEWAQLASEIGIIIASIALLFRRRLIWFGSLVLVLGSFVIIVATFVSARKEIGGAEDRIEEAHTRFENASTDKSGKFEDNALIRDVENDQPPLVDP